MKRAACWWLMFLGLCFSHLAQAQSQVASVTATVPRLVKFSGTLHDVQGKPLTGITGITFALYADESGGSPLWLETQNVTPDANGRYSASLGATQTDGLPLDVFASGEARWLGVQAAGQPEQPRVLLLSVPYALKAADAETVGGLPPSAFVLAAPPIASSSPSPANSEAPAPVAAPASPVDPDTITKNFIPLFADNAGTLSNSTLFQSGSGTSAKIGVGTTTPTATLDVKGVTALRGSVTLPATGTATASGGKNSQPFNLGASVFNSTTQSPVVQTFRWQAEPVANNTASASGSLNLLYATGSGQPMETGFNIASTGQLTFAPGQTFPGTGTITGVTAGTDLTGGGSSGDVTLNLDTTQTDARYAQLSAMNSFLTSQSIFGNLSVNNANGDGITATSQVVSGKAISATSSSGYGVYATVSNGIGVYATSNLDAIVGIASQSLGTGVIGLNTDATGTNQGFGVLGRADGPNGVGVAGFTSSDTGTPVGVMGFTNSDTGSPILVEGMSINSSTAIPFAALGPSGQVFSVAASGQVKSNTSGANNAASFTKDSSTSPTTLAALQVENAGGSGEVAWLGHTVSTNTAAVVKLVLPTSSTSNFLECDIPDGIRKCHITTAGTFVSGSDFAEALPVRSHRELYEPGDVLVMSRDGKSVQKTTSRYSRRVVGVYSVRPAVLGAEKDGVSRVDADDIPVAITGIVPAKVSTENGPIQVGDLLVTSSTSGYAMRATNPRQTLGAVVGKAMEPLRAGRGAIRVLVILR